MRHVTQPLGSDTFRPEESGRIIYHRARRQWLEDPKLSDPLPPLMSAPHIKASEDEEDDPENEITLTYSPKKRP